MTFFPSLGPAATWAGTGGHCDKRGALRTRHESAACRNAGGMSLTLEQRTNLTGMPKAAELIEITGAHALEASDRAILNLLYQHAHDSGRLADPTASWEMPITALRSSKHNGTDRVRDSLSRLLSVQVKVAYREAKTGRDRILLTHLFESFDMPADEGCGRPGPISRSGFPRAGAGAVLPLGPDQGGNRLRDVQQVRHCSV
jgi:hypothetical protein